MCDVLFLFPTKPSIHGLYILSLGLITSRSPSGPNPTAGHSIFYTVFTILRFQTKRISNLKSRAGLSIKNQLRHIRSSHTTRPGPHSIQSTKQHTKSLLRSSTKVRGRCIALVYHDARFIRQFSGCYFYKTIGGSTTTTTVRSSST